MPADHTALEPATPEPATPALLPARVLITGSAGFIGYHLAQELLDAGCTVHGFDAISDYYDPNLKRRRHAMLLQNGAFSATEAALETPGALGDTAARFAPDVIIHLAAQAGVRYSLEAPRAYLEANITGSFEVLEAARELSVKHLLMASTSSVYGANTAMPYREADKADTPMSFYAATKKANEAMAHAYAHLHGLPITLFRFFTVYGPWGRPDMALFKFTRAILEGRPIDVYNHGNMARDFTYVTDLVRGIRLLVDAVPTRPARPEDTPEWDSLSPVAPCRTVNIGNGQPVQLMEFITAIEQATGKPAEKRFLPMQKGDVPATWADAALLERLTGYRPQTRLEEGVRAFVEWYRGYYGV